MYIARWVHVIQEVRVKHPRWTVKRKREIFSSIWRQENTVCLKMYVLSHITHKPLTHPRQKYHNLLLCQDTGAWDTWNSTELATTNIQLRIHRLSCWHRWNNPNDSRWIISTFQAHFMLEKTQFIAPTNPGSASCSLNAPRTDRMRFHRNFCPRSLLEIFRFQNAILQYLRGQLKPVERIKLIKHLPQ